MLRTEVFYAMTAATEGEAVLYPAPQPKATGFRGIWYANQPSGNLYAFKYSGGLATFPQQHHPIAVYAEAVDRTYFCFGGTRAGENNLLHLIADFDHATGTVSRPTILLDKRTDDAHDNPTMALDDAGHLWIFSNAHGTSRPAYVHRSREPYSIDAFELVWKTNFSYAQPWWVPGQGFFVFHTRYGEPRGRALHWMTSVDGRVWSEPRLLAAVEQGHYQISARDGKRIGTAFNLHPERGGLNARTDLYYIETCDFGETWRSAEGEIISLPLTDRRNPALVYDGSEEGRLVYLKHLVFDRAGHPVILYLTSRGYAAGPENGPRLWWTARWTGREWRHRPITTSDNNYDFGSLYIEGESRWGLIAPTDPGPQPYNPGGEVVRWLSEDRGETWRKVRALTYGSQYNHTYVRRPLNAHPGFAAFWADGDTRRRSESALYFADREGDIVWRLPPTMRQDRERPEIVFDHTRTD